MAENYMRKTINFGNAGDPARQIIEQLESQNINVSEYVKCLVLASANYDKPEFKKRFLLERKKRLAEKLYFLSEAMKKINAEIDEVK